MPQILGERLPLNHTERLAVQALHAQQQQLNQQFKRVFADIDVRLGLGPGSVGTTHGLDSTTWEIVQVLTIDPTPPEVPEAPLDDDIMPVPDPELEMLA